MPIHFSTKIHFLALVKHCKNYEKKTLTNDLKVNKLKTHTNTDLWKTISLISGWPATSKNMHLNINNFMPFF